jgi:hypothetical protein
MMPMRATDPDLRSPSERHWRRLALLVASLVAVGVLTVAIVGVGLAVHSFTDTTVSDAAQAQWEQQTGLTTEAGGAFKEFDGCAVAALDGSGTVVLIKRHNQWALAGKNSDTTTGYWDFDDVNSEEDCRAHAEARFVAAP